MHRFRAGRHAAGWSRGGRRALALLCVAAWLTGLLLHFGARDPETGEVAVAALGATHRAAWVVHLMLAWASLPVLARWLWPHWLHVSHRPVPRLDGWINGAAWLAVPITGVALQVFADTPREWAMSVHWWVGVALPLLTIAHVAIHRRVRHRDRSRHGPRRNCPD